ncbi:hypothetical protein QN239_26775 [Mycolicibacterium sp. Y3]
MTEERDEPDPLEGPQSRDEWLNEIADRVGEVSRELYRRLS